MLGNLWTCIVWLQNGSKWSSSAPWTNSLSRLHHQPSGAIGRVLCGPEPSLDVLPHHAGTQSGLERGAVGRGPVHQGLRLGAAAGHRPHSMGRRDGRRRYVRGEEARFDGAVCTCIVLESDAHWPKWTCISGVQHGVKSGGLILIRSGTLAYKTISESTELQYQWSLLCQGIFCSKFIEHTAKILFLYSHWFNYSIGIQEKQG